jgi:transposase-like protein
MGRRRSFTREFKESAVELYHSSGRAAKDIASELGIDRSCLSNWIRESKESANSHLNAFPGRGNPRDEELARLRKENADLRETNEILKKATAFFATQKTR